MEYTANKSKYQIISRHYYGDTVRAIFLIAGVMMLVTFPFFSNLVPTPLWVSISVMVLLVVFGGLINPVQRWILVVNSFIPIIGFALFEYQAAYGYLHLTPLESRGPAFFWSNQLLALLFFVAIYLSIKTVRGRFVEHVE